MERPYKKIVTEFFGFSLVVLIALVAGTYLVTPSKLFGVILAYLLTFLFVGSNFIVIRKIRGDNHTKFFRQFFISISVRFILIIIAFVLVLKTLKIHQISFTVSFIISYILHSVIEMISINKLLETDN